uniref:Uncharacterized protein n=1 Tax=Anopheles albimanus TaxID=7167 RepID=A0A182FXN2_ANOAL
MIRADRIAFRHGILSPGRWRWTQDHTHVYHDGLFRH